MILIGLSLGALATGCGSGNGRAKPSATWGSEVGSRFTQALRSAGGLRGTFTAPTGLADYGTKSPAGTFERAPDGSLRIHLDWPDAQRSDATIPEEILRVNGQAYAQARYIKLPQGKTWARELPTDPNRLAPAVLWVLDPLLILEGVPNTMYKPAHRDGDGDGIRRYRGEAEIKSYRDELVPGLSPALLAWLKQAGDVRSLVINLVTNASGAPTRMEVWMSYMTADVQIMMKFTEIGVPVQVSAPSEDQVSDKYQVPQAPSK